MVLTQIDLNNDKPIQYILGRAEFCGLWFEVTTDTLIPRPETEVLIEYIVKKYEGREVRILDLGTGCGNIAVALAKNLKARVYAVDVSIKALSVAARNAVKYKVVDKIEFYCSDWFRDLEIDPVDIIVGNPPYIAKHEWSSLPSMVKDYEPRIALWGGENGLDHYKVIFREASRFLVPGGELVLEIGWNQGDLVKNLAGRAGNFANIDVKKDHELRDRVISANLYI